MLAPAVCLGIVQREANKRRTINPRIVIRGLIVGETAHSLLFLDIRKVGWGFGESTNS